MEAPNTSLRRLSAPFIPGNKIVPFRFYSHTKANEINDPRIEVDQTIFSNLHEPFAKPFHAYFTEEGRQKSAEAIQLCFKLTVKEDLSLDEALKFTYFRTTEQFFQGMKIADKNVRGAFLTSDISGMNSAKLGQGRSKLPESFLKHLHHYSSPQEDCNLETNDTVMIGKGKGKKPKPKKFDALPLAEKFGFHVENNHVYAGKVETVNRYGDPDIRYWFTRYCSNEQWHLRESALIMGCCLWIKFVYNPCYNEDVQRLLNFTEATSGPVLLVEHAGADVVWADGGDGKGTNKLGKLLTVILEAALKGKMEFCDFLNTLNWELSQTEDPESFFSFLNRPNREVLGENGYATVIEGTQEEQK